MDWRRLVLLPPPPSPPSSFSPSSPPSPPSPLSPPLHPPTTWSSAVSPSSSRLRARYRGLSFSSASTSSARWLIPRSRFYIRPLRLLARSRVTIESAESWYPYPPPPPSPPPPLPIAPSLLSACGFCARLATVAQARLEKFSDAIMQHANRGSLDQRRNERRHHVKSCKFAE